MKNLPDKIYLNFGEITKEEFEADDYNEFCKLDEYAVTFSEDKVYDTDVEYVRKDAFIEKACEYWYQHNRDIVKNHGAKEVLVCSEFTVNVEDFRKYMEE